MSCKCPGCQDSPVVDGLCYYHVGTEIVEKKRK